MASRAQKHQAGHVIDGKYEVLRLVGEGAMGIVYEAKNVWTERHVALKVMSSELAEIQELAERFLQEGRSATMVAHPSVVEVLDMGRDPADGSLYLVQEFLTGASLEVLLAKRGKLPFRDALDIAVPVMAGLAAAHRRGVVHRDIKPANIVLAKTAGGTVVPKIIDFGVAKLMTPDGPSKTAPGTMMGTPCYMAPEQLVSHLPVDHRADIWAMGVVLYEMLAGRRPFDGALVSEVCIAVSQGQFPALGSLAKGIPEGLIRAVYGALSRRQEDRFATMDAFLEAVLSAPGLEETAAWLHDRHADKLPYRRSHPRFSARFTCEVTCASWRRVRELVSCNVSRSGVFLASASPPAIGTRLELGLSLPDGSRMRLAGEVVRVVGPEGAAAGSEPGFAVRFDGDHDTELTVLEQVAAAHQGPGYEPLPEPAPAPKPAEPRSKPRAQSAKGQLAEAVGIDFGTSYSSVSIAFKDKVYVIPDGKQRMLQPSVVCYPRRAEAVVGWDARLRNLREPERTVGSIKRLLGRSHDDPAIQGYLSSLPYPTARGPGNAVVLKIDDDAPLAPPQIAARIIELLRQVAEGRTGQALRKAVLSVPLAFSEPQRQAVQRAATLAGLEVLELIGEPVAALLAYGLGQHKQEIVAVYDFGGGTFDFSLVDLRGNKHEVLANAGDHWLGGDDFDMAIASAAADRFWRETKIDVRQRAVEWQRLMWACEQAKRTLTTEEQADIVVERILEHPKPMDLRLRLSRPQFEKLCVPAFEASLDLCREALARAGLVPAKVDRVVITGGTSRVPFIQRELGRFFDKVVQPLIDPEQSVCIGAGLRAAQLTGHKVREAARSG